MKLGIIMPPKPESFDRAKELGLDFVEFDCNPIQYGGQPKADLLASKEAIKEASDRPSWTRRARWSPKSGKKCWL